jgi:plasmid replication initiation protein
MEMKIDETIAPSLEKGIAAQQGRLVNLVRGRATADAFQKSDLEESGLRNLLDVARESPHVAVVTNYIRYQVGRDSSPRPTKWAAKMTCKERGEDEAKVAERTMAVGEWVADDIEHTVAQDLAAEVLAYVADEASVSLPEDQGRTIKEQAAIRLTRSYLGYLLRAFVIGPTKED